MMKLSQTTTRKLLDIHGWSGILLGLLLYVVIVTGTAAVFAEELAAWSSPAASEPGGRFGHDQGIDHHIRRLAAVTAPALHDDILLFPGAAERLHLIFHTAAKKPDGSPGEHGIEYEVDSHTGKVLAQQAGWVDELSRQRESDALSRFLIDLHVRLHVPNPWGLLLTGLLGLSMMIAAVTGFLVHRHLLRELFTLRLFRDSLLRRRDLHVVAGSWNLPFAFLLAFTGSFFSFAGSIGIPALAMVAFQGDQDALIAAVVGAPPAVDERAVLASNLDLLFADARERTGADAAFATLTHYGRADSRLTIQTLPAKGHLTGLNALYAPASGAFIGLKPTLGLQPSLGGDLAALMTPLHFGNFAGIASRLVWLALGTAAAYVTFSGLMLWCRRREAERRWQIFERVVSWVAYGLPLALLATFHAFFLLPVSTFLRQDSLLVAFLLIFFASGMLFCLHQPAKLTRVHLLLAAILLLSLPMMRCLSGGPSWLVAISSGQPVVMAVDLGLLMMGLMVLWFGYCRRGQTR